MAYLISIEGPIRGALFPLQGITVRIGRGDSCAIRVPDEQVSREHVEIEWDEGVYRIVDLESRNGVRINGLPIETVELHPGDEISLGNSVFLYDDGSGRPSSPDNVLDRAATVAAPATGLEIPVSPAAAALPATRSSSVIGESVGMSEVYRRVAACANTDLPVLLTGESGTGKELIARALHANSPRRAEPFVAVNCANLTSNLLASELFGHEKGAFTGAEGRRIGLFEAAGSGTIFLDEIGELDASLQAGLLRVLAEREFTRVGGHVPIQTEARVVAATNRNLPATIEADGFREDLYYRLNVLPIALPALRDRKEDIPRLVEHFLDRSRAETETAVRRIGPAALDLLAGYAWPGNVRELKNLVERLAIFCPEESVAPAHLPDEIVRPGRDAHRPGPRTLAEAERECLLRALEAARWNKSVAAESLGIGRSTLYSKLDRHGIETPER